MTRPIARSLAVAAVALGVALPTGVAGASPTQDRTDSVVRSAVPATPASHTFRFGCRLDRGDGHPVVRCRWAPIENRRVAGYVVYRAQVRPEQLGHEAIARVRAGHRPVVADRDLTPGTAWVYAAVAIGHDGQPVAVSNLARIAIPAAP